jgi:predicted AAA+ superfamily ATPase
VFRVPLHDRSLRKQAQNPKKVHLIDTALTRAFATTREGDLGARLENVVFLHERRRCREIYYAANGREIDLVVPAPAPARYVNVVWSLTDPDTRERELSAMAFGAERYPDGEGRLVAHETAGVPECCPAYRYLLGD